MKNQKAFVCPKCHTVYYGEYNVPCQCGYRCVPFASYTRESIGKMTQDEVNKVIDRFFHPDGVDTSSEKWTDFYISTRLSVGKLISEQEYNAKKDNDYTFWHLLTAQWFAWLFMLGVAAILLNLPAFIMVGGWIVIILAKLLEESNVKEKGDDIQKEHEWDRRSRTSDIEVRKYANEDKNTELTEEQKKYIKIKDWCYSKPSSVRARDVSRLYLNILKAEIIKNNPIVVYVKEARDLNYSIPLEINRLFTKKLTREQILKYIMCHDVTFYFDLDMEDDI